MAAIAARTMQLERIERDLLDDLEIDAGRIREQAGAVSGTIAQQLREHNNELFRIACLDVAWEERQHNRAAGVHRYFSTRLEHLRDRARGEDGPEDVDLDEYREMYREFVALRSNGASDPGEVAGCLGSVGRGAG